MLFNSYKIEVRIDDPKWWATKLTITISHPHGKETLTYVFRGKDQRQRAEKFWGTILKAELRGTLAAADIKGSPQNAIDQLHARVILAHIVTATLRAEEMFHPSSGWITARKVEKVLGGF